MNKLIFSLLWLVITAVIVCLILLPIYNATGSEYGYYVPNTIYIIVAVTFTRYIFLLDYHWWAPQKTLKVILSFLVIPIGLYIVDTHYEFQRFLDEEGLGSILKSGQSPGVMGYIKNQFMLFWAWAFLCCLAIPIKMIRSIWRDYKSRIK